MIEFLFKSRDFVVCVKPQGVPSQADQSSDEDMVSLIGKQLIEMGESKDIYVIHRLDRGAGGVMVYARTKSAAAELSRLVAEKDGFEKHYLAVVSGVPQESEGSMLDYLFKDSAQKKAFAVKSERKGAKLASLDYKVNKTIESGDKVFSLVSVKLNTGRFHQIRAQFSSRMMPLYGDGKYGSREKHKSFALWSNKLIFTFKSKRFEFQKEPDHTEAPWNLFN